MIFSAESASLLAAAERGLPSGLRLRDVPIPTLMSESSALQQSAAATDHGEPLSQIAGAGIAVLHSYARTGWQHAVDQQWLRADVLARLQQAAATLPRGFGIAVFDAWRP